MIETGCRVRRLYLGEEKFGTIHEGDVVDASFEFAGLAQRTDGTGIMLLLSPSQNIPLTIDYVTDWPIFESSGTRVLALLRGMHTDSPPRPAARPSRTVGCQQDRKRDQSVGYVVFNKRDTHHDPPPSQRMARVRSLHHLRLPTLTMHFQGTCRSL